MKRLTLIAVLLLTAIVLNAQTVGDDLSTALAAHGMDASISVPAALVIEGAIVNNNALLARIASDEAAITVLQQQVAILINPAPPPPPPPNTLAVTQQPINQTAKVGSTATFTATSTGAPCQTAIYKNGNFLDYGPVTPSNGVAIWTTPAAVLADNGSTFYIQFYGCSIAGTVKSSGAALTVTP